MSQYVEKYKKNIVIDMRKRGYSYSEIQNSIHVPRSTIAYWLRGVKLTGEQKKILKSKQLDAIRVNSEKKKAKTNQQIEEIKLNSSKQIKEISKKELWLMGIMLYWRERLLLNNESDLKKGVSFTSSDPYLIKFFIRWLADVGNVKSDELIFDIFIYKFGKTKKLSETDKINRIKEIIRYWAEVTGSEKENFTHIYFKDKPVSRKKKKYVITNFGLLRIRVRESSMLARQIAGWIKGINSQFK